MKARPLKQTEKGYAPCSIEEATHLEMHRPGPFPTCILPVMIGGRREGTPNWTWNGSVEFPTVKPSILSRGGNENAREMICHSFINDGKIQFLSDCTHEFAGQTLDLLEVEE